MKKIIITIFLFSILFGAYTNMTQIVGILGKKDAFLAEFTETLSSPGVGKWIIVPIGVNYCTVTFISSNGARGIVQTTSDLMTNLYLNTPLAMDWLNGWISNTNMQDFCIPVTAIRQSNSTGTTIMTIRVQ